MRFIYGVVALAVLVLSTTSLNSQGARKAGGRSRVARQVEQRPVFDPRTKAPIRGPGTQSGKILARYNKPLKSATLDLATGTITRGPTIVNRGSSPTTTSFDNIDLSGFTGVDTGGGFCKWFDAAVKGTYAGRTLGNPEGSERMNSIVFAYCSAKLTPGSGGPGGSMGLGFYEGYTVFGGAPTTAVAAFTLSGLPGNSASSSFFGGSKCFFIRVNFSPTLAFADGAIGYSWTFLDNGTGALNPQGAIMAGTWPFLSCVTSCSGAILQVDQQGMTDVIDEYCPPGLLLATFTFGTTSGSFTSMSMAIQECITPSPLCTIAITKITGARKKTVGDYSAEADTEKPARLFIDTTKDGTIGDTPDVQYVELEVVLGPATLDPTLHEVLWEVRDPDDPANHMEIDPNDWPPMPPPPVPKGGDNYDKTPADGPTHFFAMAGHAIREQTTPGSDFSSADTVIGSARTDVDANRKSTVRFHYGDEGGDNYLIRVHCVHKATGCMLAADESFTLTVWRRRDLLSCAMAPPSPPPPPGGKGARKNNLNKCPS